MAERFFKFRLASEGGDQFLADMRKAAQGSVEAERALKQLVAASPQLASIQDGVQVKLRQTTEALRGVVPAAGGAQMAMRNLGIQSIDVFQQLAAGAPIITTFIQQGGQVAQMAAVTGTGLGTLARSVGALVLAHLPLIAGLAGGAGVAFALFTVGKRSVELEAQQRALSVAIAGVGRSAEMSVGGLQSYVTQLKRQGVEAADATAAVAALARNPGLSQGAIGRIVGIAADAAAAAGVSAPEMMKQLAEAAKGSADAVQKLDDAFNLLTPTQAAHVRTLIDHGEKAKALDEVFTALAKRVKGLDEEALSPSARGMRELGNSWDAFIDRVAKSAPVMATINALAASLQYMASVGGGGAQTAVGTIDAQIAALSGDIPGTNATAAAMRREQRAALERLRQQRADAAQASAAEADQAFGVFPPSTGAFSPPTGAGSFATPAQQAAKEIDRAAAARYDSSDQGKIAKLRVELGKYQAELKGIIPGTEEYAARSGNLNNAIAATNKEIADLVKKGETHRTGLEKEADKVDALTRAQQELTRAYGVGRGEVARVLATRDAETKAVSEGLTPGTAKYGAAVTDLTARILRLRRAEGAAKIQEQIRDVNEATAAQERITAAYDGSQASIDHATNKAKAYAEALKAFPQGPATAFTDAVNRMTAALDASDAAQNRFLQLRNSVTAVAGSIEQAFDNVGNSITDAFAQGGNAGVKFGNVLNATLTQISKELLRLSVVNPALNALFGGQRGTLGGAIEAYGQGGGGLFGSLIRGIGGLFGGGAASGTTLGAGVGVVGGAFADGGIMTAHGPYPLRRYAGGGIARSAQVAMFGEGSMPEAYVPLPDGRSIPVTMRGAGGHTTIYRGGDVHVHVTNSNASAATIAAVAGQAARREQARFIEDINKGGTMAKVTGRRNGR